MTQGNTACRVRADEAGGLSTAGFPICRGDDAITTGDYSSAAG